MGMTIRDIAKHCGVGVGTVSRAINGSGYVRSDVKERILSFIQEKEWRPSKTATALSTGRSGVVGVLTPGLQGYITHNLLECIRGRLSDSPKTMMVNLRTSAGGVDELLSADLESILVISPTFITPENIDKLKKSGLPFMGLIGPENDFSTAHSNHYEAAFKGTHELIAFGHRSIGFVGTPVFEDPGRHEQMACFYDATAGYSDAMQQAGLPVDKDRDFIRTYAYLEDFSDAETPSRQAVNQSLKRAHHTAYFIYPWYNTLLFYCACRDMGVKIPEDVSLISLEGEVHREALNPAPACFIHNYEKFADYAIEFILSRGESPRGQYSVSYKYFPGNSIKKMGGGV